MGDSGGPVVDESGRLLGVSSAILLDGYRELAGHPILRGYRCQAYCADPDWIQDLIARDRARRNGRIALKPGSSRR
jgi:hypothetical protein